MKVAGAIRTLDLRSHKFSALTPSLSPKAASTFQPHYNQVLLDDLQQSPRLPIYSMAVGESGEMWFAVEEKGIQRFRVSGGKWDTPLRIGPDFFKETAAIAIAGGPPDIEKLKAVLARHGLEPAMPQAR